MRCNQSFEQFTKDTGIKVEYTGDKSFEGNIVTKVTGGSAPDIAIVPQPGLLKTLVETGEVKEAGAETEANVDKNWSPDWKKYGTFDGTFYAAPMLANIKGYVWYSPANFKEWGVSVPTTFQGVLDLTKTIQEKTGSAPWCAGFASDAASGWPGTDWIEDLVLRQSGPEVYDQWVAGRGEVHRSRDQGCLRLGRRDPAEPGLCQRRLRRCQVASTRRHSVTSRRRSPTAAAR